MKKLISSALVMSVLVASCTKSDSDNNTGSNSDALHLSFYTPDWNAYINCDQLVMDATTNAQVSATSQSTKETFYLTVPQDSSTMSDPANIKKYAINGEDLFTFNQTLPITSGSDTRLYGIINLSDSSYNEITSIKYDHSDANAAYFKLKASYKMKMKPLYSTSNDTVKYVYGDYHFLIKTNRQ